VKVPFTGQAAGPCGQHVKVTITRVTSGWWHGWAVEVESGKDAERKYVFGINSCLWEAEGIALDRAEKAKIPEECLVQALSEAEMKAAAQTDPIDLWR